MALAFNEFRQVVLLAKISVLSANLSLFGDFIREQQWPSLKNF